MSNLPKTLPGLQDLKDYEGYPEIYWKLRDSTVAQPNDLEADMIDRDLYRLRQISTLKLNSVERSFSIKHDPFRKWKDKAGEPLFSPKQQRAPQRKHREKTKATDISESKPNGDLNTARLLPEMQVTPLRLQELDSHASGKEQDELVVSSRRSAPKAVNGKEPGDANPGQTHSPRRNSQGMPTLETPRDDPSLQQTPREAIETSLNTYRKLQDERETEENFNFGKVTVQKLHQMKNQKQNCKKPMKTALISVDLEPAEAYKKHNRLAPKRQSDYQKLNSTGALDSHRTNSDSHESDDKKLNETAEYGLQNSVSHRDAFLPIHNNGRQKTGATVTSLTLNPPSNHRAPGSYPDALCSTYYDSDSNTVHRDTSSLHMQQRQVLPTPTSTLAENGISHKAARRSSTTPVKAHHLEVFSERRERPIKIPTGRLSYHPEMPAYRVDLKNYPPNNPRQICGRATSAGLPDSSPTQFSLHRDPVSQAHHSETAEDTTPRPPRTADINIRFAGKGEVILSSSKTKRGQDGRASR